MGANDRVTGDDLPLGMSDQVRALWGKLLNRMDERALLRNLRYARGRAPQAGLRELLELVKYYWERDNRIR